MMINKEEAIKILKEHVKQKANLEHSLYVAYGMLGVAKYLKKTEEEQNYWFIVGLLHDLDIEEYNGDIKQHTLITERILKEKNIDQKLMDDIKSHNKEIVEERKSEIQHALYSIDGLTGIIRAYVLIRPDKDIQLAKVKSIKKKLKDKTFAAQVSRDQIKLCETTLNIDLSKFIEIVLEEIKKGEKTI